MADLEKMGSAADEHTAANPKEEAGTVDAPAPKRRGRPPGSGRGARGGAKHAEPGQAGAAAEAGRGGAMAGTAGAARAVNAPAPLPRRGSKAAALAAQQAEEEALELQQLTAPHIPNCSPEWQQFYLKVRRVAVKEK
jgi:hypothetical protein